MFMMLAQFANNSDYFDFFRAQLEAGKVVILDNGAYEGKMVLPSELYYLSKELDPTFTVMPDVVDSRGASEQLEREFLSFGPAPQKLMKVMHGRDELDVVDNYLENVYKYGAVAFPRCLRERRLRVIRFLARFGLFNRRYTHFLGCWDSTGMEIVDLYKQAATAQLVNSIDTKLSWKSLQRAEDFCSNLSVSDEEVATIANHITIMEGLCRSTS